MVWNKGKQLHYKVWNKGLTKESDPRIRSIQHSDATRKKKMAQIATKKKFGKWNLGKKFSENHKTNISDKLKGKNKGEKSGNWKDGRAKMKTLEYKETMAGRKKSKNCKICNISEIELKGCLCYDHDHKTGKFRGWICKRCNFALGLVNDDIAILQKMIKYLSV